MHKIVWQPGFPWLSQ